MAMVQSVLRILDVYPRYWFLSIPDPTNTPKDEWKIFFVLPFFVATYIIKLKIILFLNRYEEFFFAKTLRIIVHFTQQFVIKLSKIWVWDPGSEIRDPEKTYSGSRVKKARLPDPGSAILKTSIRMRSVTFFQFEFSITAIISTPNTGTRLEVTCVPYTTQ